jgi:hypothetical protein
VQRHRHAEPLRQIDLEEVGVDDGVRDRVALQIAHEDHALVEVAVGGPALAHEADQMRAFEVREAALDLIARANDRRRLTVRTVEDRRNLARGTQAAHRPLPRLRPPSDGDLNRFHGTVPVSFR